MRATRSATTSAARPRPIRRRWCASRWRASCDALDAAAPRRDQSEENARGHHDDRGEGQHACVDRDGVEARQRHWCDRREAAHRHRSQQRRRAIAPPALSIRLSVSSWRTMRARAGAEHGAQCQLALAGDRSRQQQVGHVRARDQQHEPDRARAARRAPAGPGRSARRAAARGNGAFLVVGGCSRRICSRITFISAVASATDTPGLSRPNAAQVLAAPARRVAAQLVADGRPHIGRHAVVAIASSGSNPAGMTPTTRYVAIVHRDGAADDGRIGVETAPPQARRSRAARATYSGGRRPR